MKPHLISSALLAALGLAAGTGSTSAQRHLRDGNESAQGADAVRSGTTVNLQDHVEVDKDKNPCFDPMDNKEVFDRVQKIKYRLSKKYAFANLGREFDRPFEEVLLRDVRNFPTDYCYFDIFIDDRYLNKSVLTWAFTDAPLPEIDDAGVIGEMKPGVSGKPTQLAIQENGVVLVHRPSWLALSTEDKAGLVIHELMIRVLLRHRVDLNTPLGTGPLRQLNRLAASADWAKTPSRWYQEVLDRLLKHPVAMTIPSEAGASTQIKGDYYQVVIANPVIRVERDNPWGKAVSRKSEVPLSALAGGEVRPAVTLAHLEAAEAELAENRNTSGAQYNPMSAFASSVCRYYGFAGAAGVDTSWGEFSP